MTPEQKAKEIVEKHYCIIEYATAGLFEEDVDYVKARQTAAKACAIEEVRALIADNKTTYKILLENHAQRAVPPIIKREIELQNILTEIEKL